MTVPDDVAARVEREHALGASVVVIAERHGLTLDEVQRIVRLARER